MRKTFSFVYDVKIVTDMASKMITGFLENGILGRTIYRKLHRESVIIICVILVRDLKLIRDNYLKSRQFKVGCNQSVFISFQTKQLSSF